MQEVFQVEYHHVNNGEVYIILSILSIILFMGFYMLFRGNSKAIITAAGVLLTMSLTNGIIYNTYFNGKNFLKSDEVVSAIEKTYHIKYDNTSSNNKVLPKDVKNNYREDGGYWVYFKDGTHHHCETITVRDSYPKNYTARINCK